MRLLTLTTCFGFLLSTSVFGREVEDSLGVGNLLLGKTGAAGPASTDAASINPAQAPWLRFSEIQLGWGLQSYTYQMRNKGFSTHEESGSGLDGSTPIPRFVYKPSTRVGVTGMIIPFTVKQDIDVQELPIIVLGQESLVDIVGEGKLKGYADLNLGYIVNKGFSVGANINYVAVEGNGSIETSEDGAKLAEFGVSSTTIRLGVGLKANFSHFSVGVVSPIYSQNKTETSFKSELISGDDDSGDDGGSETTNDFLNPIRVGVGYHLPNRIGASIDVRYKRAKKGQMRYSIVDLAEKELDVYDTWSVYLGTEVRVLPQMDVLVGYLNEPGEIGPGAKGKDEKTGYGFFDLALNLGEPPDKPLWLVGVGARFSFWPEEVKRKKRKNITKYRMAVEAGAVYGETSIGIDEDGEQPGAYLVRRYKFPFKLIYRF